MNVGSSRYGYFLGRYHMINLIDRLKSIANVRPFAKVYRTTGTHSDKPLDMDMYTQMRTQRSQNHSSKS